MTVSNFGLLAFGLSLLQGASALPKAEISLNKGDFNVLKRQATTPQQSPPLPFWEKALPIPPQKQPKFTVSNPATGGDILYYEIEIKPFTHQIYDDLEATEMTGYDGISPGPTIIVPRGSESVVRFVNNAGSENSVHLHGSYSRAPFDGWAEDVTEPGEYKDYYYPNQQSGRLLWYHDHAVHITAQNAYRGQAGAYILTDEAEDALNLPSGYGEFDIPLILASKRYAANGQLFDFATQAGAFYGDIPHVNGIPFPFFDVEPRKYRFRILNAATSRVFALYLEDAAAAGVRLDFQVIASDSGLLTEPVGTDKLYIAMAERYEIVIDFSDLAGKTIDLKNLGNADNVGTEVNFVNVDKILRFNVADTVTSPDTSEVPATLRNVPFPTPQDPNVPDHEFHFGRSGTPAKWTINQVGFGDVQNRILANVPRDTVELWSLKNNSTGWTHPIHIHLVDFRVVSRNNERVEEYESKGLKDVVWLGKNETALVEAHYAPWAGVYMFHCHNLIHEDNDMMAAFNVTQLPDFGYNETTYLDPMEPEWRAKPYVFDDYSTSAGPFAEDEITERIEFMASFQPYLHDDEVDPDSPEAQAASRMAKRNGGKMPKIRHITF